MIHHYGSTEIPFEIVPRDGLRGIRIEVELGLPVRVVGSDLSEETARKTLGKKARWIVKQWEELALAQKGLAIHSTRRLKYFGREYHIRTEIADKPSLRFESGCFVLGHPQGPDGVDEIDTVWGDFKAQTCQAKILPIVRKWAKRMELRPNGVEFDAFKSRWGTCTKDDKIRLGIDLVTLSRDLVDYIVVHELAHIEHKDHSPAFWGLVERYLSNAKVLHERLGGEL